MTNTIPGNYVKFLRGTPNAWSKITDSNKDSDTLYFISEEDDTTGQLYLGSKLISGSDSDVENLTDLEDVSIVNPGAKDILIYDQENAQWINQSLITATSSDTMMIGATDTTSGGAGLVPQPPIGGNVLFLRGDATWADPTVAVRADIADIKEKLKWQGVE